VNENIGPIAQLEIPFDILPKVAKKGNFFEN